MKQAALIFVHADSDKPMIHHLSEHLAEQKGDLSVKQMLAQQHEVAPISDCAQFWAYSEAVNPDVSMHVEYVPFHKNKPPAPSAKLLLY